MAAQYIHTRPITNLCLALEQNPGICLSMQWWDQTALDIIGIKAGQADVEGGEDTGGEASELEGEGH